MSSGPCYDEALKALEDAHAVCFKHPDRPVLGMSHGPFSGVNVALGIIFKLEKENRRLRLVELPELKNLQHVSST